MLAAHVNIAKTINEEIKGRTPLVQTMFNPISVADMLAGTRFYDPHRQDYPNPRIGPLKQLMLEDPDAVHEGLSVIAHTLGDYAKEAVQRGGVRGLFMSTWRWAMQDVVTVEEYETFGKPYDLIVLQGAIDAGADFNVLHICRDPIIDFKKVFADYPVEVMSLRNTPGNPTIPDMVRDWPKAFWGGVDHTEPLLSGPYELIDSTIGEAIKATGGRRFIMGPGCAKNPKTPDEHLAYVRTALAKWYKA